MAHLITVSQEAIDYLNQADPILGQFINRIGPLTREGTKDPYIATIECVIAQQVSGSAAISITQRFFEAFPKADPKRLVNTSIEELRPFGLSSSKAKYILGIAEAKYSKAIDFDHLINLSCSEITDILLPLKGVGPWTIQMVLMFSLHKMDVCSYGDLGIRRGMMRLYHKDEISEAFYNEVSQRLSPYLTYASFYFWQASTYKENIPYIK